MDELAWKLKMDPIALRLKNYAEIEPQENRPFSSKALRQCYEIGADKFGWSRRTSTPRSMRSGNDADWPRHGDRHVSRQPQPGRGDCAHPLLPDGTAMVASGTQDLLAPAPTP